MMSLSTIRRMSREAAMEAARDGKVPMVFEVEDFPITAESIRPLPNLGDHRPEGWELEDLYFVDATGIDDHGPAMSVNTFIHTVESHTRHGDATYGWAIVEAGQFQVRIGRFRRTT